MKTKLPKGTKYHMDSVKHLIGLLPPETYKQNILKGCDFSRKGDSSEWITMTKTVTIIHEVIVEN